jgi:hypothetical protein
MRWWDEQMLRPSIALAGERIVRPVSRLQRCCEFYGFDKDQARRNAANHSLWATVPGTNHFRFRPLFQERSAFELRNKREPMNVCHFDLQQEVKRVSMGTRRRPRNMLPRRRVRVWVWADGNDQQVVGQAFNDHISLRLCVVQCGS